MNKIIVKPNGVGLKRVKESLYFSCVVEQGLKYSKQENNNSITDFISPVESHKALTELLFLIKDYKEELPHIRHYMNCFADNRLWVLYDIENKTDDYLFCTYGNKKEYHEIDRTSAKELLKRDYKTYLYDSNQEKMVEINSLSDISENFAKLYIKEGLC